MVIGSGHFFGKILAKLFDKPKTWDLVPLSCLKSVGPVLVLFTVKRLTGKDFDSGLTKSGLQN